MLISHFLFQTLFNKLRQASNWQDKVLMLKAIGNAGLEGSIFELEKIIRQSDGSYPMHIRFEAMVALRQLKDSIPKKVRPHTIGMRFLC